MPTLISAPVHSTMNSASTSELDCSSSVSVEITSDFEARQELAQLALNIVHEALEQGLYSKAMLRLEAFVVRDDNMVLGRGAITFVADEIRLALPESSVTGDSQAQSLQVLKRMLDRIRLADYLQTATIDPTTGGIYVPFDDKASLVASSLIDSASLFSNSSSLKELAAFCQSDEQFSHLKGSLNGALLRNRSFNNPLPSDLINSIHGKLEHIYNNCLEVTELSPCLHVLGLTKPFNAEIERLFTQCFGEL